MITGDTIAAISSSSGRAARMIVRSSGPASWEIARALSPIVSLEASRVIRATLALNGLSFPSTIYAFASPHSYTGEDLVEYHIPGNPLLARILLDELIRRGARHADAGEFTARAYFNGRIDLTEAEGVAATIAAHGEDELRAARQLAAGELARRLQPAMDALAQTLALVEVGIDFSEEDVTFLSAYDVQRRVAQIDSTLAALVENSARFERLSHEPTIVLVGRPNAGKSTLLNALARRERAVVSPTAGTTRDAISVELPLARGIAELIDVAGLQESALSTRSGDSSIDHIETQMRNHALRTVESADVVLLIQDITDDRPPISLQRKADLVVRTKRDLMEKNRSADDDLAVSAHLGTNLDRLRDRLDALAFGARSAGATGLALNARHLDAIANTRSALSRASMQAAAGPELVAVELRDALDALGVVLGTISPDDLLTQIFSRFCIGK